MDTESGDADGTSKVYWGYSKPLVFVNYVCTSSTVEDTVLVILGNRDRVSRNRRTNVDTLTPSH